MCMPLFITAVQETRGRTHGRTVTVNVGVVSHGPLLSFVLCAFSKHVAVKPVRKDECVRVPLSASGLNVGIFQCKHDPAAIAGMGLGEQRKLYSDQSLCWPRVNCVCVCMHVCLCVYVCMYMHVCIFTHIYEGQGSLACCSPYSCKESDMP